MVHSIFQSKISHYIAAVETGVNENVKKYMKTIEDGVGIIQGRATEAIQIAQETSKLHNNTAKNLDDTAKNHLERINVIEERVKENWGKEGEFKNLNESLQKVQNKLRQTEHDLEVFRREAEQKDSDRAFKILNYDTYSIRNLYDEKLIDAVINILMDGYPGHLQNKKTFEWIRDQIDDVAFNHNDKRQSTPMTVFVQNKASRSFIYSYYKQERTKHKATVTQYLPPRLYHIHERLRMAGKKYKQDHPYAYTRVATVRSQTKSTYMRYVLQAKDNKEAPWRIIETESDDDMRKVNEMRHKLPQASNAIGRDRNDPITSENNRGNNTGRAQSLSSAPTTETPRSRRVDNTIPYSRAHQQQGYRNNHGNRQPDNRTVFSHNRFQHLRDNDEGTVPEQNSTTQQNDEIVHTTTAPNSRSNSPNIGGVQQVIEAQIHSVPETPHIQRAANEHTDQRTYQTRSTTNRPTSRTGDNMSISTEDESITNYAPKIPMPGTENLSTKQRPVNPTNNIAQADNHQSQTGAKGNNRVQCNCSHGKMCIECENISLKKRLYNLSQAGIVAPSVQNTGSGPNGGQQQHYYNPPQNDFDFNRLFRMNANNQNFQRPLPAQQEVFGEYLRHPRPTSTAAPRSRQNSTSRSASNTSRRSHTRKTTANSKPSQH